MKIYVASSWRNERQQAVVAFLRSLGHDVYDFRNPTPGDHGFGWRQCAEADDLKDPLAFRDRVLAHPVARAAFAKDMGALHAADATVLVLPCGRSAHLELGWATGAGKRTIVLLDDPMSEPELMYLMNTRICVSLEEVEAALAAPNTELAELRAATLSCAERLRHVGSLLQETAPEHAAEQFHAAIRLESFLVQHERNEEAFDRLRTIVDEAFGMQPCMGINELLTTLERELHKRRVADAEFPEVDEPQPTEPRHVEVLRQRIRELTMQRDRYFQYWQSEVRWRAMSEQTQYEQVGTVNCPDCRDGVRYVPSQCLWRIWNKVRCVTCGGTGKLPTASVEVLKRRIRELTVERDRAIEQRDRYFQDWQSAVAELEGRVRRS